MSNKPFNETARNLQLDETAEENDRYILCGELQDDEGEWVPAEIDLDQVFGASDAPAQVEWGGRDFAKLADCVVFDVNPIPVQTTEEERYDQIQERPMLYVTISDEWRGQVDACVDLSDGIVNNNGQFELRLDQIPHDQRIVRGD
ncbi:hypothetical protein BDV38DRAFT_279480 [Aspergillus pseudotamarii]|uniref:Cyanovirin-N domain-containing protein n=1 Tax=Aspergillus pseudotamarii TaxID=132259 RepID=A0A5N6T3Y5_ASPPS|nr:uncharacterized protein BDV38DRAFT_279480 [Aspergillus pseudotamarii]KAE8141024.1 hypothetical protein BDV38DRAFT_279480 [Aspergillus pseudotamarii]